MNRLPREPLDADERALAARLPRLHGRDEPDPALDARILAAAHAGLGPMRAKPRRSWIVPLSAAASVSLAVGLAWQLQPPPGPPVVAHAPVATAIEVGDGGQAADQAVPPPPPPPMAVSKPPHAPPAQATPASDAVRETAAEPAAQPRADSRAVAPVFAPPPPPPPAPAAPVVADAAPLPAPAPQAAMARSATADAGASASGALMQSQAKRVRANEADLAAGVLATEEVAKASGEEEEVPPATMDAPAARDAWLRRITELQQQGRIDEAKASLAEFRRRHPDAPVPPELRKLEP